MLRRTALVGAYVLALPWAGQSQEQSSQAGSGWTEPARRSPTTVSADLLRHPLSSKTRRMLRIAIERMRSGDHRKAIQQLETTLAKDPSSAAYVQGLLGYEYMRTDQVSAALPCFERAVLLVPHEPTNHHNFAVALAVDGNYGRAEQEALRAHDLAPDNPDIERFLEFLRAAKGSRSGTQLDAQSRPN